MIFAWKSSDDNVARITLTELLEGARNKTNQKSSNHDEVEEGQYHDEDNECGRALSRAFYLSERQKPSNSDSVQKFSF